MVKFQLKIYTYIIIKYNFIYNISTTRHQIIKMTICLRCVKSENTLESSGFVYPNPLALRARGFGSTNPLFLVCSP